MSDVFPSPTQLSSVIGAVESLLDLLAGPDRIRPAVIRLSLSEPEIRALPPALRARLASGTPHAVFLTYEEPWRRRLDGIRELEDALNPSGHPFAGPHRAARLTAVSVGWFDPLVYHGFRPLFEAQDELLRLHQLTELPETGCVLDPFCPIREHLGFTKEWATVDRGTDEVTTDPDPSPLGEYDVTVPPPPIPFWVIDHLQVSLERLRRARDKGHLGSATGDRGPDPVADGHAPQVPVSSVQARNGPREPFLFRYGVSEIDFDGAPYRHRLICALWDDATGRPHPGRDATDVMGEVWGEEDADERLKDLCKQVSRRFERNVPPVPLKVSFRGGKVWLAELTG